MSLAIWIETIKMTLFNLSGGIVVLFILFVIIVLICFFAACIWGIVVKGAIPMCKDIISIFKW